MSTAKTHTCMIDGAHSRLSNTTLLVIATLGLALTGCGRGTADLATEEEHAHGGTAVTIWTDSTELFFEYPAIVAGVQSEPWAIHVTRLSDFSPVTAGALTLALRSPGGSVYTTRSDAPARPGIYTPAPTVPEAGSYDLVIDVDSPQLRDRIAVGSIDVFAAADDVPEPSEVPAGRGISFLKEQQWPIEFTVARAQERDVARAVEIAGEIVPAAGRVAVVAAPVSGLALAQANLSAPAPSERVRSGQTLAVLSPTSQDNSYARAKANAERLERDVARLARLYEVEAIPEKRLVEARYDLEVARSTLEAMGVTASTGEGYNFRMTAPISGVVQRRPFAPGQRVEVGETLFEIVNPDVVWLRLRVPARLASHVEAAGRATFTVEGSSRVYRSDRLAFAGSTIDASDRTLPVTLAVSNADGSLKIGQFARALLGLGDAQTGVAVPNEAIQNEDGQPVIYVQTGGESFERRIVVARATDGLFTLIDDGVEAGEYVVTRGAYQVYLASLNTSEISDHGHPH